MNSYKLRAAVFIQYQLMNLVGYFYWNICKKEEIPSLSENWVTVGFPFELH